MQCVCVCVCVCVYVCVCVCHVLQAAVKDIMEKRAQKKATQ